MATLTEQSSTRPKAMPISPDQLQAAISKPAQPPVQKEAPKEVAAAIKDEAPKEAQKQEAAPKQDAEQKKPSPNLASIGDEVERKMNEKKAATEAKAKEEAKPKTEAKIDAPAKTDAAPAAEEEISAEERGIMPHDSERVRKRINHFLKKDAAQQTEINKIKAELEAAKKLPQTAVNLEEVEKLKKDHADAQNELIRFRRLHEVKNDPEFRAKYHEPVAKIEETVEGIFKKYKLDEGTLKTVKDAGGFAAFSESSKAYPIVQADPDNPGQTVTVHKTGGQLLHGWLNSGAINPVDAETIKASLGKQALLKMEAQAAEQKAQEEAKGYFENQTAAQRKAQEEAQAVNKKHETEYTEWLGKTQAETDWLKDVTLPDNASEDDKKSIVEQNSLRKELRESLQKHPSTAFEYGQLKLDAAKSRYLERNMADKDAEIARLTEQLKSTKAASKTTAKSGSLLAGSRQAPTEKAKTIDPSNPLAGFDEKMKALSTGGDE